MRAPVIIPPLFLALIGIFACFIYTTQWPQWALRFEVMQQNDFVHGLGGGDYRLFWAQGNLAAQGKPLGGYDADVIISTAMTQHLKGVIDVRPSFYPPHFIMFMEPLGHLDYPHAWHFYNWGSVLLLAFITLFAFRREYYALPLLGGFSGLWCALSFGQNSIVLTALYLALAAWGARHERIGGLLLAIASFKPHLGVLAPLMLLWRQQYRTFVWAVLGVAALVAATVALYGEAIWIRYWEVLQEPMNRLVDFRHVQGQHMISLYSSLRAHELPPVYALAAQAALALVAVQMLWRICRRALDPMLPVAGLVTATLIAIPHAYSYDMILLFIPIMVIVRRAQSHGWQWADAEALLPVYILPYYVGAINNAVQLPLVPLALLFLLYRLKQHSRMDHA